MYTILYTCDVIPETKPEMAKWAEGFFPWLREQKFIFHRSMRNIGIDSPELVAYFDFADEMSAQEFWSSDGWKEAQAKFKAYTRNQREYRLTESPLSGRGIKGTQEGSTNCTILYTCDVIPEMKQEMGEWAQGFFPWLRGQKFIFHRSMRSAGIDSPELVAYFDFADEASAQELWSSDGWKEVVAKFRIYTRNQREYRLGPSPVSGQGIVGTQAVPPIESRNDPRAP